MTQIIYFELDNGDTVSVPSYKMPSDAPTVGDRVEILFGLTQSQARTLRERGIKTLWTTAKTLSFVVVNRTFCFAADGENLEALTVYVYLRAESPQDEAILLWLTADIDPFGDPNGLEKIKDEQRAN